MTELLPLLGTCTKCRGAGYISPLDQDGEPTRICDLCTPQTTVDPETLASLSDYCAA